MQPIEIITIIACVLIVGGVIGSYIYKKVTHKPTGCSGCSGGCSGNCANCSSCTSMLPKVDETKEHKDEEVNKKVDDSTNTNEN